MFKLKSLSFLVVLSFLTVAIGTGCSNDSANLTIEPESTVVEKGTTAQFTANRDNVTWSVEGGNTNGTIDEDGLYTPPTTLPINPAVTIKATTDSEEATATVNLRTADTVTFGDTSSQISADSLPFALLISEIIGSGMSNRLYVQEGSLHVDSIWTGYNGMTTQALFNQNVDFTGFGSALDIVQDVNINNIAGSIVTYSDLNPGVVVADNSSGQYRLKYFRSEDQGQTFGVGPVIINPSFPGSDQFQPNLVLDAEGNTYLVYSQTLETHEKILFSKSTDKGDTWSVSLNITGLNDNNLTYPQIAVSEDGKNIHVCYQDDKASGGATSDIFVTSSFDNGTSFQTPIAITDSGTAEKCRIATGPEGNIYVSFADKSNYNIFITKSTDSAATFGENIQVNDVDINFLYNLPMLSVDPLGRVDIVYSAEDPNNGGIIQLRHQRSLDQASTFGASTVIVGEGTENFIIPFALASDSAGRLHVQYGSDVLSPGDAFYNQFYKFAE